ncbi:glycosyltransferase family 2 protein [Candidatus Reidiella endopervernicosa]|uniref:Glycosyltransferase n=1 Tax=Candidatus Reidiella endopervernicosa TaxID=2738883 RepID=A0A6N0HSP4_9GAMM|nr:glycosyltransferase [Candidatus Reidiella endopervernicosa]QKQ25290.1 glycosyltransferase [Candidatus Reidiella endopervernicosa]
MGRLSHLQQSLPLALAQPNVNCIVVDYSCPNNSGDWVRAHHPEVTVVDVPDQMHFSAATARNLGAGHSDTEWLLFLDADILLPADFLQMTNIELMPDTVYRADTSAGGYDKYGSFLVQRAHFEKVGGFDETFPGSRYFCESLFWASKPKQTAKTSRDRLCLRRPDRPAYVA